MASWGMGTLPNSLSVGCRMSTLVPLSRKGSDAHRACPLPGALSTCAATPLLQAGTPAMDAGGPSAARQQAQRPQGRGQLASQGGDLLCPHQDKCCPFTSLGDQLSALSRDLCPGSTSPAQSKLQVPAEGPALLSTHIQGFSVRP